MKIIEITTFFYPVHGGIERLVYDLSLKLIEKGHQVKVFCSDSSKQKKAVRPFTEIIDNIKIQRFRTILSLSRFHKLFLGIIPALINEKFDIVHVHGFRKIESYFALFIAKLKKKKCILSTHNPLGVPKSERSLIEKIFLIIHDVLIARIFLRFFDSIICLSKEEIHFLKKFGVCEKKIFVVPNAVNDEFTKKINLSPKNKKNKFVVLSVGRINKMKGFQFLLASVKKLKNVQFTIAGPDDGYLDKLKEIYKNCKNIKFIGPVDKNNIKKLLQQADIFILPSINEPFGIAILEAMAAGLPIIATKNGGPKEIVKKSFGFLINPTNQTEIKKIIKKLYNNPKICKTMGQNARMEVLKKYTWKTIFPMYERIFES